ncbi:MAG: hypothetical protein M5U27_02340 [Gaiella sp.]|nr:hypothetical protein [Gaiella sp.]
MSIPREISATRGAAVGLASIVGAAFLAYACHVSAAVTLVALGLHLSQHSDRVVLLFAAPIELCALASALIASTER